MIDGGTCDCYILSSLLKPKESLCSSYVAQTYLNAIHEISLSSLFYVLYSHFVGEPLSNKIGGASSGVPISLTMSLLSSFSLAISSTSSPSTLLSPFSSFTLSSSASSSKFSSNESIVQLVLCKDSVNLKSQKTKTKTNTTCVASHSFQFLLPRQSQEGRIGSLPLSCNSTKNYENISYLKIGIITITWILAEHWMKCRQEFGWGR